MAETTVAGVTVRWNTTWVKLAPSVLPVLPLNMTHAMAEPITAPSSDNSSASTNTDTTTAPAPVASTGTAVTIVKFAFSPETITVPVGASVTWTNQDLDTPHIVAFSDQSSPKLDKGATWSRSFSTPGTYTYKCGVHPYMTGTVVVK